MVKNKGLYSFTIYVYFFIISNYILRFSFTP